METLSTESSSTPTSTAGESSSQSSSGSTSTMSASADSSSSQSSPQSGSSQPTVGGETQPQAEAYMPDWKFKAANKEHEIDEWLRPVVKNKEHEQKLKELYEKAFGLDEVKTTREKIREEYKGYKSQTEPLVQTVTQASQLYQGAIKAYQDGNVRGAVFKLEEAFKHLGINEKVLQNYVFQKLKMDELPADQKAEYNRQRELETQFSQVQEQMQHWQSQAQQMAVSQRQFELQQATSKPEVASVVSSFDQRNGPGSFQNEVILRGKMYWDMYQQDMPAEQLVQEVITKYGLQAPQAPAAPPQAQQTSAPRDVPVIPTVKGGSGSPAAKSFQSLDDIKAYRKQVYGS